jgi:glutamate-1-semialdehyde aminotransferase
VVKIFGSYHGHSDTTMVSKAVLGALWNPHAEVLELLDRHGRLGR